MDCGGSAHSRSKQASVLKELLLSKGNQRIMVINIPPESLNLSRDCLSATLSRRTGGIHTRSWAFKPTHAGSRTHVIEEGSPPKQCCSRKRSHDGPKEQEDTNNHHLPMETLPPPWVRRWEDDGFEWVEHKLERESTGIFSTHLLTGQALLSEGEHLLHMKMGRRPLQPARNAGSP
jgi:hypothetical protein